MEKTRIEASRWVDWLIAHPLRTLLVGVVLVFVLAAGLIKIHANFGYRTWFREDNPKLQQFDAFERKFGSDDAAVIVLHSPSGIFDKDTAQVLIQLTNDLWQVPEVIRVDSLSNFNWTHAKGDEIVIEPLIPEEEPLTEELLKEREKIALEHRTVKNYLVSEDGKTALLFARLKPALETTPDYQKVVFSVRDLLSKYNGQGDHSLYLTGSPTLNHAFKESALKDMERLIPLVILMTILFLIFNFRNVSGVVIPLVIIALTDLVTVGWGGWLGFELNNLTSIVPQFMIAIAVAVSVHLLVNFYHFYAEGIGKQEALRLSLEKNLRPTLLTSLSTAIGFFSYSTSGIPPVSGMGMMAGYGTLWAWVITYLFVPPMILFFPIKKQNKPTTHGLDGASKRSKKITEWLFKGRRLILLLGALLMVTGVGLAMKVRVNSDPFKYFDPSYPLTIANNFVEKHVGGSMGMELVIDSGRPEGIKDPEFLRKVDHFQSWLDTFPFVTKTISIVNILKEMNQSLHEGKAETYRLAATQDEVAQQLFLYTMSLPQGMDLNDRMTLENDAIRLTAMWTLHDSADNLRIFQEIEDAAKEMGLNAHVTGKFPLYQSNNQVVVDSFIVSLSLAVILVGLLLCFGLQSIPLGILSMLPNALPLITGAGVLYLLGKSLDIGTVIVASICLGIAVDDTIHFLANFKRAMAKGDTAKEAVAKVMTHTAPALITTTMVLVASFATFILATFVPNQDFGIMVSLILIFALIADLTFLPALLMTIYGKKEAKGRKAESPG